MTKNATERATSTKDPGTLAELYELLEEFDAVMLTTVADGGVLRSRPMAVQIPKGDVTGCDLYFVTEAETPKVDEVEREEHVAISAMRSRDKAWLSISAVATIERDQSQLKRAWKPEFTLWMPEGENTERAALLKLRIVQAEYWEPAGGRARVLIDELRAVLKGESPAEGLPPPKVVKQVA